jgi:hypothetical protein
MHFWNRRVTIVHELSPLVMCCMAQLSARIDSTTGKVVLSGASRSSDYTVALPDIGLGGTLVRRNDSAALYRINKPLRIREAVSGLYPDGWIRTDAEYARFAAAPPATRLFVRVSRDGWAGPTQPAAARVEIVRRGHVIVRRRYVVRSAVGRTFVFVPPRPPFEVRVHVASTFSPSQYGKSDPRQLGAQVSFRLGRS